MSRYVLYLTPTIVIFSGKSAYDRFVKVWNHSIPNANTGFEGWLLKFDFIEESTFKCLVHVLSEVRCGNEDSIESFHFLKNDVLNRVLHLFNSSFGPLLSFADDCISLVK